MLTYIAKRILLMVPTLLAVSALVFFIIYLPPRSPWTDMIEELQDHNHPAPPPAPQPAPQP